MTVWLNTLVERYGLIAASVTLGLSMYGLAATLIALGTFPKSRLDIGLGSFERLRREAVRRGNGMYRLFEPLVHELAGRRRKEGSKAMDRLQRNLSVATEPLPWDAVEFVASKRIEGVLFGTLLFLAIALLGKPKVAIMLGLVVAFGFSWLFVRTINDRAKARMHRLRIRLPFCVDLIALMMEAGASFQESLQTVVAENRDHPVGQEFGEVLRQIALGRTRREALTTLQTRLEDDDIAELVFAINKGEEMGTPLSTILRDQADQMREKRSQWGEKAAAEAEIQLVFPGMVVMVACLLVILGPILLPAILPLL